MADEKTYEAKYDNLMRALDRNNPTYVPTMAFPGPAIASWAHTTCVEAMKDPGTYVKALNSVFADMWVDCTIDHGAMSTPEIDDIFHGDVQYKFGPDGTTVEHIQNPMMRADEYDQLIADPTRFVDEVLLPRKMPWMFSGDMEAAKNAVKEYTAQINHLFIDLNGMLAEDMRDTYGIVSITASLEIPALDMVFDYFRGFKGTLTDIRRHPGQVGEAVDRLWEVSGGLTIDEAPEAPFPFCEEMPHMPAYLSPDQFDALYWPNQKAIVEKYARGGSKLVILLEGNWMRVIDRFRQVPKDSVIMMVDDDDIFDVYDAIGDWQIVSGGVKLAKTRLESKESNIEYAKRVIDHCAPGGGFLFGTDKNWISPGDVNQNLVDVYNYAHEYGRY